MSANEKNTYILISDEAAVEYMTATEAEARIEKGEFLVQVDPEWISHYNISNADPCKIVADIFNEAHRLEFVH